MRIRHFMTAPFLFAFALAGCIKEDLSRCRTGENITFLFSYGGERGEGFTGRIGEIDLFLFDGEGKYMFHKSAVSTELPAGNPSMSFVLTPGTYYALAWANVGDNSAYQSLTPGVTSLDECLVEINPASTRTGDPVYYAPRKARQNVTDPASTVDAALYEVIVPPGTDVEKTLDFVRAHRSIYVWIRGFHDNGLNPTVEARGLWSRYDFHYRTHNHRRNFVQQAGTHNMEYAEYALATFHHAYGDIDEDMNVVVARTSNGEVSHTVNVRRFLEENPTSGTDDIHIMLSFSYDLGVTVSLPHWIATPVQPTD